MADLALLFPDLDLELDATGQALLLEESLFGAVVISMFSDARATAEDLQRVGEQDPRGYTFDDSGDRVGSRLWTLGRETITEKTLRVAEQMARDALEWMTREGIVEEVVTLAERHGLYEMRLLVQPRRGRARARAKEWEGTVEGVMRIGRILIEVRKG